MTRKASLTVVLASLLALPLVRAQGTFPTLFDPIFDLFGPGGLAGLYTPETALFWDSIIALMIFVSLAQFALKDRFGGKAIPIAIGIALSVAYITFELATGFRFSELAPLAVLVIFGLLVFFFFTFLERFIKNKFLAGLLAFAIVFALLPPTVLEFLGRYVVFDWIIFFYTVGLLILLIWLPIAIFRFLGAGSFGLGGSGGGAANDPIFRDAQKSEKEDKKMLSRLFGSKEANPEAATQARQRALTQIDDLSTQELQIDQDLAVIAQNLEQRLNSLRGFQVNMNNYFQSVGAASQAAEQISGEYVEKLSQTLSEADKELQALMLAHKESAGLINKNFETGFADAEMLASKVWNKTRSDSVTQKAIGRLSARLQSHTGFLSTEAEKLHALLELAVGEPLKESDLLDAYRMLQVHEERIKEDARKLSKKSSEINRLRSDANKLLAAIRQKLGFRGIPEEAIISPAVAEFIRAFNARQAATTQIPAVLDVYNRMMAPMKEHLEAFQKSVKEAKRVDRELVKAFSSVVKPGELRRDIPSLRKAPKSLHEYLRLYGETLIHFVRTASKFSILDRMSSFLIERVRTIHRLHQSRLQLSENIHNHIESIKTMRTAANDRVAGIVSGFETKVLEAIDKDKFAQKSIEVLVLFADTEISAVKLKVEHIKPKKTPEEIRKQATKAKEEVDRINTDFINQWRGLRAQLHGMSHQKIDYLDNCAQKLNEFMDSIKSEWERVGGI